MKELYQALAKFQKDPPKVLKDAENPHFKQKYATLGAIMGAVLPKLNEVGLVVVQHTANQDEDAGVVAVETHVIHASTGQEISSLLSAKTDGNPQHIGSALTYLRRYGLSTMLGLVTEDDDDGESLQPKDTLNTPQKRESTPSEVQEGPKPADKEPAMRKKILDICMKIAGGDTEQAGGVLEDLTEWKEDGKIKLKGIRKGGLLNDIKGKRLGKVYGKAKEAEAAWGAASQGEPQQEDLSDVLDKEF